MMFALPIVDRELRVAARRKGTYWLRFWVALLMLVVWMLLLENSHFVSRGQMGQHLLNALGILALGFSMLAGVFLTADCLSEEKREGTIGLLFLTDLKTHDIVLGKLAANSLAAFFGLLSIFPIFGLSVLLGGVTGPEFGRLSLVFVTTLFFSLSLGMVVSAMTRDAKQAIATALLLMVFFAGICPAIWAVQRMFYRAAPVDFLLSPSPGYAYLMGFDSNYHVRGGPAAFWTSVGTMFGLGVSGILLANFVLPRVWQEGDRDTNSKRRLLRGNNPPVVGFATRLTWQRRMDPMHWLGVRDRSPQRTAWVALMLLFPIWAIAMFQWSDLSVPRTRIAYIVGILMAYAMHLLLKLLIAAEAGRRMNQDRRSGAWELLLVTPLKVEAILEGQKKALQRHFFGPMLLLVGVNVAMMISMSALLSRNTYSNNQEQVVFCEIFIGGIVALFVDFYGLAWVGMWRGLNAKQHHRAVIATLGQIMLPPLLAFFFLIFARPSIGGADTMATLVAFWFILGIIVSGISGGRARNLLQSEFRDVVAGTVRPRIGIADMKDAGI
jgi:ABC-type transport system involved in multi-copper enzyme maturation permease subunit